MKKLCYYILLLTTLITHCIAVEDISTASFDVFKQAITLLSEAADTNNNLEIFKNIEQELDSGNYAHYNFKKENDNTVSLLFGPKAISGTNATDNRNYNLTQEQFNALETIITNLSNSQIRSGRNRSGQRPSTQTTETQTDEPTQATVQQESPANQVTSEPSSSRNYRDEDDDDDYYKRRRMPYIPASEIKKDKEKDTTQDDAVMPDTKSRIGKSQSPTSGMKKPDMNQQRSPYGPQPSYYKPMHHGSFGGPRESLQPRTVGGQSGNKTAHVKTAPIKKLKDATPEERQAIIPEGSVQIAQQVSGTQEPEYSMPKRITACPQKVDHERRTARKSGLIPRYDASKDASLGMSETAPTSLQKEQPWSITHWFTHLWKKITGWFGAAQ